MSASMRWSTPIPAQTRGLIEGGADTILIETVFDTLNAKAAGFAVEQVFDALGVELPIMISGTITDLSGRNLSGQTPEAFWYSMQHLKPFSIGLNCAFGAEQLRPSVDEMAHVADTLVSVYPNAGLPNEMGEYDESPEFMAGLLETGRKTGSSILSAAAAARRRTTSAPSPRPFRNIRRAMCRRLPTSSASPASNPSCMGSLNVTNGAQNFVMVGERTNVTGSARFRKLIEANDYAAALEVARQQVESGANMLDVNMDEGMLDSEKAMVTFLNLIAAEPDISRVPIMINSSKWIGDRGGAEMRARQGGRQFHQPEGRRGAFPRSRAQSATLRRRRRGDGLRRKGPGRDRRAQIRHLQARLRAS